jgi:uncharacterized protein
MQFKVKDIGEDGLDVDLALTPAWLANECRGAEVALAPGGLRFKGRLELSGDDYLLRGRLAGALTTACARCLETATLPVDFEISVMYTEHDEGAADSEEDDDEEAPDVIRFSDGVVDLSSELREEILLALPVRVLCREDCAGLCPVCGGNRNANPCTCEETQRLEQSKFAALAKLKS